MKKLKGKDITTPDDKTSKMKKIFKRLLFCFLILLILFSILMLLPRTIAKLYPDKKPIGYLFTFADYLALATGLEKLVNMTPEIPVNIEEIRNIEYTNVNGKSLQLDLYRPKNLTSRVPLLVFIHGGGWTGGQRSDYLVYLVAFAKKGYMTATVSYRLLADSCYPACAEDIRDAVEWLFTNSETYGYDPDRIALVGGSAGAHLALLTAYGWHKNGSFTDTALSKHRIRAVVDIYGPVDLTTEYARTHPLVTNFISKAYDKAPELYVEASPIHYIDKNDPPTLILQGSSDNLVPASQSVTLKKMCDEAGVPSELYILPLWPHTMDIVRRVNEYAQKKMNDFFGKYLR